MNKKINLVNHHYAAKNTYFTNPYHHSAKILIFFVVQKNTDQYNNTEVP